MLQKEKLEQICERFQHLEVRLTDGMDGPGYVELAREYSELKPVVAKIRAYRKVLLDIEAARAMQSDAELRQLADEELTLLNRSLAETEEELTNELIPKDADADRSAILEVRSGTGGDEAALFAADLFRMYERYSQARGWTFNELEISSTQQGGYREATAEVAGKGAFARLKFESGVHRVQRVPVTESSGRIHTSAATVAVLPQVKDIEIEIDPSDLRIETMRASGAGGQHVNKTDSAVRLTHIPTGIVVNASEKSQHQNRASAMRVLKSRLYDQERRRIDGKLAAERRQQVGEGDRSEKIRTYNFPEGRVTDHRINLKLHRLEQVLAGDLDELVDALIADDQATLLGALGN